jgi:hypothetical protein
MAQSPSTEQSHIITERVFAAANRLGLSRQSEKIMMALKITIKGSGPNALSHL